MDQVTTIGLDVAKSVFQVHGIAADGTVVFRRQLRRAQVLPFFEKQASCLNKARRVARSAWGTSPRRATAICDPC